MAFFLILNVLKIAKKKSLFVVFEAKKDKWKFPLGGGFTVFPWLISPAGSFGGGLHQRGGAMGRQGVGHFHPPPSRGSWYTPRAKKMLFFKGNSPGLAHRGPKIDPGGACYRQAPTSPQGW